MVCATVWAPKQTRRRMRPGWMPCGPAPTAWAEATSDSSTTDLRVVLNCYALMLQRLDEMPAVVWQSTVPVSSAIVRILVLQHVVRGVAALKRAAFRRVALDDKSPTASRNLKMLKNFEYSLPSIPRRAAIAPLALVGILVIAYVLGNYWIHTPSGKLLGDLTSAAVKVDRNAAVEAFKTNNLAGGFYVGGAIVIAWSVALTILPLLPAFAAKRRLFQAFAGAETVGFAALGVRHVHDVELDLLAELLLVLPLFAFGIDGPIYNRLTMMSGTIGLVMCGLAALATVELHSRYTLRRGTGAPHWQGLITRFSLRTACAFSLLILLLTFTLHR
jgi:hypothetical protein